MNQRIQDNELRVIDSTGEQLGVISREAAMNAAEARGLDLVVIAQNAKPPVAKITDFKKFLYEQEKKDKEAKKGAKKSVVKDIKISLFIGPADLERMISKTKEFLDDGNQVRLNLTLKGREIVKKQMAFDLMNNFIKQLEEVNVSKEPRFEGRVVRAVVSRKK
ncbi:translation initiation factor IF-3 [Candidatus Woesebacteria bacterium]|nr:translation initiation factor IF-3 [Candidatus Woesebacteria bacterium]